MNKVLKAIGIILLIPVVLAVVAGGVYVETWILHWALNLFFTISMKQAFAIIVIMHMFGGASVTVNR